MKTHQLSAKAQMTDTDRLNALFTLFGGAWAMDPFFTIQNQMKKGRSGLDEFIKENPGLLGAAGEHESDAFAAGERKGRIEGIRWSESVVISNSHQVAHGYIVNELVRLEREQESK